MVFVEDPWFNEPGRTLRSRHALQQSRQYDLLIRFYTLQHAVLPAIRNPPTPFEEACRHHFRIKKKVIEKQCHRWVMEARGSNWESQMRQCSAEIKAALQIFD